MASDINRHCTMGYRQTALADPLWVLLLDNVLTRLRMPCERSSTLILKGAAYDCYTQPPYSKNGRQYLLWDDMRTASHKHMHAAFQNRRQQVVRDCYHLKLDADSYNQNYNKWKPIQMIFDFV